MDFYSLKRKELQALCKKHGIPANISNLLMAQRLAALLQINGNATSEEGNENNSKDAPKKLKKVRFSPDNETREYEPSAYEKRGGRSRRKTLANPVSKESGQSNLSENVVRKKRGRGSEKIGSNYRITRSRAKVDNETFSVLQKSTGSQEREPSKNTARDNIECRKGSRRSKRNVAEGTDSELMKVDVVSMITRSVPQFPGNASTVENEVSGFMEECEGAVQVKEFVKGLGRNGSRRKSVARHNDQAESYGQDVLKETRNRSVNLDFGNVNAVKASSESRQHTEKASITVAGPRRSRRKAAVMNSTAANVEQGARGTIGKDKQSNENASRKDAEVPNVLRRSTRNASRQSSVATFKEMNEIADGARKVGQLKRKREALQETEASPDGSWVGESPRRSTLEVTKSGLVGLSAACKSVQEKATEHIKNANDIIVSPLSEVNGLTMQEAVFKSFEKRGEPKIKTRGKRSITTADVSTLHSDIGEVIDTATNVEDNLASTPLMLESAVTEEASSNANVSGKDAKVSNLLRRSTRNASRQSVLPTSKEMNEIADSVGKVGQLKRKREAVKETESSLDRSLVGESPRGSILEALGSGLVGLSASCKSVEEKATEHIENVDHINISQSEDTGLIAPEAASKSFEKRGESNIKTRGNRSIAVDISALRSGIVEERNSATNLEENLASTPLALASAATEEAASKTEGKSGASDDNKVVLVKEIGKLVSDAKGGVDDQSCQSLEICANLANYNSAELKLEKLLEKGCDVASPSEGFSSAEQSAFAGQRSNFSGLEKGPAREEMSTGKDACYGSYGISNNSTLVDRITTQEDGFCGLERTKQDDIKDEIQHSVVPHNRRSLPAVSAENFKRTNKVCQESNKTVTLNSNCEDENKVSERMVSDSLPQFYFENLEDGNVSITAMSKNCNGEVLPKHGAVNETEASPGGSLVRELPRRSTVEALNSALVGLSAACKSVVEKATENIKNPLGEDTGLTMPETVFNLFMRAGESKTKSREKGSATVDVSALHSGVSEEKDSATHLEENLASTPLVLATDATKEASKIVEKPVAIFDNNVLVDDIGKPESETKGGVDDQSCQLLETRSNLANYNSAELKFSKFQAKTCDVAFPTDASSSANQSDFTGKSSNSSGFKKGMEREEMPTNKEVCYCSDGISGNSTEVDRISIQEDGVSGLERTEQDHRQYEIEHNVAPSTVISLPAVSAEIVTKSTKNVRQGSNKTITPNSNSEDRKNVLERMIPDGLPQFCFENLEDGNMSNTAMAKNNVEIIREQNFGDRMVAEEQASFGSSGGKPFSLEALSASDILELPSKKFHRSEETVMERKNSVDAVTDLPITKICNAVMNTVGSQSMDEEPEADVEQQDKKSNDSGEMASGKFVEEQLNAVQCDQVVGDGSAECAWVVKLSDNNDSEEVPTKVNDNSDESWTENTCESKFPKGINRVDGMEENEATCKVSDSNADTTVKINGYHMDEEAADMHDVICENVVTAKDTYTMTLEIQEVRSGGISQKNKRVEPGKAILDSEEEFSFSKLNDDGPAAMYSEVAYDKTTDGATLKGVGLDNLEEKSGSELDISDYIALGIDVNAAEADEKVENMDGNLKGKDLNSDGEKESDNIVFSSHEIASLKIQVESAIFTNWEVNLIEGNGAQDEEIISDENLLENKYMNKVSDHVMHPEDQFEKSEEVTEDGLVSEDSGHIVLINDITNIEKLGQFAEMQFSEALPSITKETTVDHGVDEVYVINQEIIDDGNCEDKNVKNLSFSGQEDVWVEPNTISGKEDELVKCNAQHGPENNISSGSEEDIENRACVGDKEVCTPTTVKIDIPKEVAVGETALSVLDEESHETARSKLQTIISNCSNREDNRPAEALYLGKPEFTSGCTFTQQNAIAEASSEEFKERVEENDDTIIGEDDRAERSGRDLNDRTDGSSLGKARCPQEVARERLNVHQNAVNESDFMDDVDYITLDKLSCESESQIYSSEAGEAHCFQKLDDEVLTVVETEKTVDFGNLDTLSAFKNELLIDCSTTSAVCSSPYNESEALLMTSEVTEESKMQYNMPAKIDDTQGSIVRKLQENESLNVEHFHVFSENEILVEDGKTNASRDAATLEQALKCPCNLKQENTRNLIAEDVRESKEPNKDIPKIGEVIDDKSPGFTTSGVDQDITGGDSHSFQRKFLAPLKKGSHPEKEDEPNVYGGQSMMQRKTNMISLIQGTPQKALDSCVMKENAPSIKRQQVGARTAPKTLPKRRPLEDLKMQ